MKLKNRFTPAEFRRIGGQVVVGVVVGLILVFLSTTAGLIVSSLPFVKLVIVALLAASGLGYLGAARRRATRLLSVTGSAQPPDFISDRAWRRGFRASSISLVLAVPGIAVGRNLQQQPLVAQEAREYHDSIQELVWKIRQTTDNKTPSASGEAGTRPVVDPDALHAAEEVLRSHEAPLLDRIDAAVLLGDPAALTLLDELDKQTAVADYTRHQRRGDYHYFRGEYDDAIGPYEKAIELRPDELTARNNAAIAHTQARLGDIAAHQRRAIEIYEGTLERFPRASHPGEWATTQNNLGNAWMSLRKGDRGENLRRAIECYEAALEVHTRATHPIEWATMQNNLGVAWAGLLRGDRGENLGRAIECYEAALEVITREARPVEWAVTQNNLGFSWSSLPKGVRSENLGRAIAHYEAALEVFTRTAHPVEWAVTQNSLGDALVILSEQPGQNRCGLLKNAISSVKGALTIYTPEAMPHDHAETMQILATMRGHYEAATCSPPFDGIKPAE